MVTVDLEVDRRRSFNQELTFVQSLRSPMRVKGKQRKLYSQGCKRRASVCRRALLPSGYTVPTVVFDEAERQCTPVALGMVRELYGVPQIPETPRRQKTPFLTL